MDIKPVRLGLILGLVSIIFGIFWVVYITAAHEDIHEAFDSASMSVESELSHSESHDDGHDHDHGDDHDDESTAANEAHSKGGEGEVYGHAHDDPLSASAHAMLTKGHVHAMGLGLLTLCVSILLSLVCIPRWLKTLGAVSVGVGGLIYPFSWITMGYKLPAVGMEAAEAYVMPIVGISLVLILAGLLITLFGVVAGFFFKECSR